MAEDDRDELSVEELEDVAGGLNGDSNSSCSNTNCVTGCGPNTNCTGGCSGVTEPMI